MNYDRMFSSNKRLNHVDVEKIFLKRFYRPHKISLQNKKSSLHINVSYAKPQTVQEYNDVFVKLARVINKNDAADLFINIMKCSMGYPDFILVDCEIIDIPFSVNLHIPAINLQDE